MVELPDLSALIRGKNESSRKTKAPAPAPGGKNTNTENEEYKKILCADIVFDPDQPRKIIDEGSLQEFAKDIKAHGVLQPIIVRPKDKSGKYKIIAGERRLRASLLAGKKNIPAIIHAATEGEIFAIQLAENINREDLSAMEIARGIQRLIETYKFKKNDVGKAYGKSPTWVTNHLALTALPPPLLILYESGQLTNVTRLADLSRHHAKYTDEIERFCKNAPEILSTKDVDDFIATLKPVKKPDPAKLPLSTKPPEREEKSVEKTGEHEEYRDNESQAPSAEQVPYHNPDNIVDDNDKSGSDKIKKPLLLGTHQGNAVQIILKKQPSAIGKIFVKNENTGEIYEIDLSTIVLTALLDSEK